MLPQIIEETVRQRLEEIEIREHLLRGKQQDAIIAAQQARETAQAYLAQAEALHAIAQSIRAWLYG